MTASTFSDHWHRVSSARVGLLPTVTVHKQRFRGADWYVLRDTYTQRFYRVTPRAYAFISRLSPATTVDDTWRQFLADNPIDAPGQEEVVGVLGELHQNNLLLYRSRADGLAMFRRKRDFEQRELRGKLLSFLYIRIPLWDPNDWLNQRTGLINALFSKFMAWVWIAFVLAGGAIALSHARALSDATQGILAVDNLIWLYLCMAGLKTAHEFGHAFMVKRFGGEVHTLGVMLLILMPLPFMDATASWAFRSRRQRALVGAAGMIVELFLAAIAAIIWVNTGPGLIHSLAFNVMFIGSVSSIVFNGNPLMRFDAYYVLCDLIDIPNLYQRANQQWLYFADRYLLGTEDTESPAKDKREWAWLTGFGITSFIYRMIVVAAIVMFVTDQWFMVGVVFAATTAFMLVVTPVKQWWRHITGGRTARNRRRAMLASLALIALPLAFITWVPLPTSITAPGVVEAVRATTMPAPLSGQLVALNVQDGQQIEAGAVILQIASPELDADLAITRAQARETELMRNMALAKSISDVPALDARLNMLRERETELTEKQEALTLRARHRGVWVAPGLNQRVNSWLAKGERLGELVELGAMRFVAVIPQEEANALFQRPVKSAEVRLTGQSAYTLDSSAVTVTPYQRRQLASPALGWLGGGQIAVNTEEKTGQRTLESFFEVQANLRPHTEAVPISGMTGWLRLAMPWRPLLDQIQLAFMQLLQKRYQL